MKVSWSALDSFVIECSRQELDIPRNALNNIPQPVDECEYTTLIGATKEKLTNFLMPWSKPFVSPRRNPGKALDMP
jgi:hypothetical protein